MSQEPAGSLAGRTVVVTGGGGFVGRRLLPALVEAGASRVVSLEHGDSGSTPASSDSKEWQRVSGDILRPESVRSAVEPGSWIVHLAAMTHAGLSVQEPESCFEVNAMGTVRVLEACRVEEAAGILFVSTGLVYGPPHYLPVDEEHPTAPISPYAASKLAAEAAVFSYGGNYGLPACIVRLSNVYGAGGHPDAVHSIILRQIVDEGRVELLDLSAVRDFLHVDTVVEGLVRVLAALDADTPSVVNLSSGRGVTIEEFARALVQAYRQPGGEPVEIGQKGPGRLSSVRELVLDNRRLEELTGWRPSDDELRRGASRTMTRMRGRHSE